MKVAILDCHSGISGDMTLGAFLDAGFDFKLLERELSKLQLRGYKLSRRKLKKLKFVGTKFDVHIVKTSETSRTYREIHRLISSSRLHPEIRRTALKILDRLASAEAKIHGVPKKEVHFHEAGGIDSIVDMTGVAICVHHWQLRKFFVRNLCVGQGETRINHGRIALPSPATWDLLSGFRIHPVKMNQEIVTPTGAAILSALAEKTDEIPSVVVEKVGYGAGTFELSDRPNLLRLTLGKLAPAFKQDRVLVLETNLDDMSPLGFESLYKHLFEGGALDVFVTSILMKKMRPAFKLSVLFEHSIKEKIAEIVFNETSSFGVRFLELDRFILERKIKKLKTKYGPVRVKLGWLDSRAHIASPEYEDCKKIALRKRIPFREVYKEAQKVACLIPHLIP